MSKSHEVILDKMLAGMSPVAFYPETKTYVFRFQPPLSANEFYIVARDITHDDDWQGRTRFEIIRWNYKEV